MGKKLTAWNKDNKHGDSLQRIRAQMTAVCAKLPAADPARAACDGALQPAKSAAGADAAIHVPRHCSSSVVIVGALGAFIWSSDRITLEGERTIYTVTCERGAWDGLRCSGRIAAGDRHRFRSSRSRNEVVYWIAGSPVASGKYTDCNVTDRDLWSCKPHAGEQPSIAHELSDGRPVHRAAGRRPAVPRRDQVEMVGAAHGNPGIQQGGLQQYASTRTSPSCAPPDTPAK